MKPVFDIDLNYNLSKNSFIYDNKSKEYFLDLFCMFSSLPLGYNHPIFDREFERDIITIGKIKTSNKAFKTEVYNRFDNSFKEWITDFHNTHYCSTGALAVEAACKCAYFHNPGKKRILTFKKSFHGIYGFTTFLTDKFSTTESRLNYLPSNILSNNYCLEEDSLNFLLKNPTHAKDMIPDVAGILVEPIKCTYGDEFWDKKDIMSLRLLADTLNIPLIFDEIQVGFGATGKQWYYKHLDIIPDILIYGKRTQISGIATSKKYSMPNMSDTLGCTWDGDIVDMLRCVYIMNAFKEYNILDNVNNSANVIKQGLKNNSNFLFENEGLIMSAKFETTGNRDKFYNYLFSNKILSNPTGERCIRFRPSLGISETEIIMFIEIVNKYEL